MKKFIILSMFFLVGNIALFANNVDNIIEKIIDDTKKTPELILKDNPNSIKEDGENSFSIRSEEYLKSELGYSWFFSDNKCMSILYNCQYNRRLHNEIISKFEKKFGKVVATNGGHVIVNLDDGIIITIFIRNNTIMIEIMINEDSKYR